MKKLAMLLLLLPTIATAQTDYISDAVIQWWPADSTFRGNKFYNVAADTSIEVDLIYPNQRVGYPVAPAPIGGTSNYSGYLTFIIKTDTTGVTGDRDSLKVTARPLFYDAGSRTYQTAVKWLDSGGAAVDSLLITGGWLAWGTGHVATKYRLVRPYSFPPSNGVRFTITTGTGAACRLRVGVMMTK